MYILACDTTAKTASVCVAKVSGESLVPCSHATVNKTLTHSESLLPMIDFCLKNACVSFNDIDIAAVSAGPGSFTGVRIGVSTIKGLAYGNKNISCIGVSSLESLAYNLKGYTPGSIIVPVMDARRNQFYNAAFSFTKSGKIKRYRDDSLTDFAGIIEYLEENFADKKIVLVGDGAELFYSLYIASKNNKLKISLCEYSNMYQDAFSVAVCAYKYHSKRKKNDVFSSEKLSPIYLRASQAERELKEKQSGGNSQ